MKSSVLPSDQCIFLPSLETHMSHSLTSILAWISNHHDMIEASHKEATLSHITHIAPITHYFTSQ